MSDIVIKTEHLSKQYRLGTINHGMLYKDIQSWWARVRGRDDPNAKLAFTDYGDRLDSAGHFWALRDLSFEVRQGEVLGIIGKNGAGKSTLLKILSKVTAPTNGVVKIKGRIASLLEVGTGFHPELTGRENVYLNGAILGMSKKEIAGKFDEIVDFAEIEEFIDTPVKRYSSGMYVRLAFAVAAHLEPEILIVDEVLAVGDAAFQKKCLGKMGDVSKQGRTILFVSHNMGAIRQLCSRGILLDSGVIVVNADIEKVINEYLHDYDEFNTFNTKNLIRINESKARINDFIIDGGMPTTFFPIEFVFCISLEGNDIIKGAELAISFSSSNKEPLFQLFSRHMGEEFDILPGVNYVRVKIDSLPLAPGVYSCNLWLGRGDEPLDWIQDCFYLKVVPSKFSKQYIENRGYPIVINAVWKYEK